jgi:uncharacterized membrane protein YcaP (DUF421 family)
MPLLLNIVWHELYTPDRPILESFLRGTIIYLSIFILLRFVLKRQAGNVGLSDMLLIVLIADASQNAMANDYKSVPNGLVLVGTLVFWNYALDWLSYRVPGLGHLTESPPLPLIRDGQLLKENLRKELITEEDLRCQLRKKGYADPSQVREGFIEGDGHFSFLPPASVAPAPRSGTAAPGAERNGAGPAQPEAGPGEPVALPPSQEPAPGEDAALHQFLDAAQRLQTTVAWHRDRIAEHQQAIAAVTGALSRRGVRTRAFLGERKRADAGEAQPGKAAEASTSSP